MEGLRERADVGVLGWLLKLKLENEEVEVLLWK